MNHLGEVMIIRHDWNKFLTNTSQEGSIEFVSFFLTWSNILGSKVYIENFCPIWFHLLKANENFCFHVFLKSQPAWLGFVVLVHFGNAKALKKGEVKEVDSRKGWDPELWWQSLHRQLHLLLLKHYWASHMIVGMLADGDWSNLFKTESDELSTCPRSDHI